jgi:hypothetical protein
VACVRVHLLLQCCQHGLQLSGGLRVAVARKLLLVGHLTQQQQQQQQQSS